MARTIGNVDICRSGIVFTAITIVITIVFRPEFLLFKVECLIGFGKAIIPGNHEIFKPVQSWIHTCLASRLLKNVGKFEAYFCPGHVL